MQQPPNPGSARCDLYVYTNRNTCLPKMTSLLASASTTVVCPLTFLHKSLVDTVSADQSQPRCWWAPNQKPFPEGRGASSGPLHQTWAGAHGASVKHRTEKVVQTVHVSWATLFIVCIHSVWGSASHYQFLWGEKSLNRLFIRRLSIFSASAFPSTLNSHMHFKLSALERRE